MPSDYSLQELALHVGADLLGPADLRIARVCSLETPSPDGIAFVEQAAQAARVEPGSLGALVVPAPGTTGPELPVPRLVSRKPRLSFALLMRLFHPELFQAGGVHPTAWVHPTALLESGAWVGPFCMIGAGCRVGERTQLKARVVLEPGCRLGTGCKVEPSTHLGPGCTVGDECHLEAWSRLEAGARLGSRVYLGSRSITRAGARIGAGTKIDNLAVLGHYSETGEGCILVGQTLLGDRVRLGRYVVLGAQVVVQANVEIADQVQIAGRSIVVESIGQAGQWGGDPAQPLRLELKERALRVRALDGYLELRRSARLRAGGDGPPDRNGDTP